MKIHLRNETNVTITAKTRKQKCIVNGSAEIKG